MSVGYQQNRLTVISSAADEMFHQIVLKDLIIGPPDPQHHTFGPGGSTFHYVRVESLPLKQKIVCNALLRALVHPIKVVVDLGDVTACGLLLLGAITFGCL